MTEPSSRTRPQPHRFRVSVPVADEAVVAWMGLQDNPSLSVRLLIRESIERMGYVDVMNRPVAQLPKRGRPAGSEEEPPHGEPRQQPPAPDLRGPAPAASTELDLRQDKGTEPELLGIALEAPSRVQNPAPDQVSVDDPSPVPSDPEQPSGGQVEVNDLFATLRQ